MILDSGARYWIQFFYLDVETILDINDETLLRYENKSNVTDHMMAMKMIDQAHIRKGRIRSFNSYCGGLPSPAAANNPLAYKFRYFNRLETIKVIQIINFLFRHSP